MKRVIIEVPQGEGKAYLNLYDPTEEVMNYTVDAFLRFCEEMKEFINYRKPRLTITPEDSDEVPYWFETGVKFKEGVPHYRTRYWCKAPGCLSQGNQYIKLTDKTTECHECGAIIAVRPALKRIGPDGIPVQDRFGNFFRADKLVRVENH